MTVVVDGRGRRICDWCKGPIAAGSRIDAETCSKRCRQARHRFRSAIVGEPVASGQPRRIAYADPPYPGKSERYYGDHPDYGGEVDHAALVETLLSFDAWALSTSAAALPAVLALCPSGVRVAAWFRGERPHNATPYPVNSWEPVIYGGDIRRGAPVHRDASRSPESATRRHLVDATPNDRDPSRVDARRIDALIYPARARRTDPARVIGSKPAVFCRWIFDLLGATPEDTLTDLFPGSGGVGRAWGVFCESAGVAS